MIDDWLELAVEGFARHPWAAALLGWLALFAVAALAFVLTRWWLHGLLGAAIRRSSFQWDDALVEHDVLRRVALLAPFAVVYYGVGLVPHLPDAVDAAITRVCLAGIVLASVLALFRLFDAANSVYSRFPLAQGRPIKGYLQLVKLFLAVISLLLIVAFLLDRSPVVLVTGVGALTAVLLLIFRDTILSLVASVQITSNDLVRIGDWIEVPKFGADGDVVDIALHTVKIQNFDKTITTVPTYKLIDESFKNWRGMREAGGRRIKRSLALDMTSVRFLEEAEIDRFSRFVLLADYIERKRRELAEHNSLNAPDGSGRIANARRLTNLGTFRAWIGAYLAQHPALHRQGMTFLVRQLEPAAQGVPLEIYVFTQTTVWADYEAVQADIFDHLLAMVPEFGLRVFQQPSGYDIARLAPLESVGALESS